MIILGLGSNISDRAGYLAAAIGALSPVMEHIRLSRVLESQALLPEGAIPEMDLPFLNMVIAGECSLAPDALLQEIKALEAALGRQKRGHWGPREIDIDILAMDDTCMEMPALAIPHRELLNRDFALVPLGDVAPGWHYPLPGEFWGKTAKEIIQVKGYGLSPHLRETGIILHV